MMSTQAGGDHLPADETKTRPPLGLLAELAAGLRRGPDLPGALALLVETISQVLPAVRCGILVLAGEKGRPYTAAGYPRQAVALQSPRGEGPARQVFATGEPFIAADVASDPHCAPWREAAGEAGVQAVVCLPLGHQPPAAVEVHLAEKHPFTPQEISFLSIAVSQVAAAVAGARQVEQEKALHRQADLLQDMVGIVHSLTAVRELREVLERVAYSISDVLGFRLVALNLIAEDDPDYLELVACVGLPLYQQKAVLGRRTPVAGVRTSFEETFRLSRSYYVPHQHLSPAGRALKLASPSPVEEPVGEGWHPDDLLLVPLVSAEGQELGVLSVEDPADGRKPDAATAEALEIYASQAAVAVENARLYRREKRRSEQLEALTRVSSSVTSILAVDELLDRVTGLLVETFAHYDVFIGLVEGEELVFEVRGYDQAGKPRTRQVRLKVGEEGITGWVARHGQPLLVPDVREEPRYYEVEEQRDVRSELALPLKVKDKVLGVLDVSSRRRDAFDESDLTVFQSLANQLAIAIENARLFEEELARTREVMALAETGRKVASTLELDAVLDSIMDACLDLFQVQQAAFIVMDEDGYLRMRRHRGFSEEFVRSIAGRPGEGHYGKVYQSGEPILVRDIRKQLDPATAEAVLREGLTSLVHVPVKIKGETVAVMNLTSVREDRRFNERDLERLSVFANQAAIAVENARLFSETKRALEEVRMANETQRRLLARIKELSTPVLPVTEGVLVLPLIGTVDEERASLIMERLLKGITDYRARVAIIDITGVPVVDTQVAHYLLGTIQAARLLGTRCVLVGITPKVAQTVVDLGVDLSGIATRSSLQEGLAYAWQVGRK